MSEENANQNWQDSYKDNTAVKGFLEGAKDEKDFFGKVLGGYSELSSKMGSGFISKPGEKATDEQKAEYRKQLFAELGAAKTADDFKIEFPKDAPEGFFNGKILDALKPVFLEAGLSPDAASKLVNTYVEAQLGSYKEYNAQVEASIAASEKLLKDSWKDKFEQNVTVASNFFKGQLGEEKFKAFNEKYGNDPDIITMGYELAKKLNGEDSLNGQGSGGGGKTAEDYRKEGKQLYAEGMAIADKNSPERIKKLQESEQAYAQYRKLSGGKAA